MKSPLLCLACAGEIAVGLVLMVDPQTVAELLLGSVITGAGVTTARIAGIALIALGVACWPSAASRGLLGMALYNVGAGAFFVIKSLDGGPFGVLWWPAVALHVIFAILLTWSQFRKQER